MSDCQENPGWLQVCATFVVAQPAKSKIAVVEVSPERWHVTFPTNATGLRWFLSFLFVAIGFFPLGIGAFILGVRFPWLPPIPTLFGLCIFLPLFLAELVADRCRRFRGGVILLEPRQLHFERGAIWRVRQDLELEPTSRFEVADVGGEENILWVLQLVREKRKTVLATMNDLSRPDLQWLCHRFNEFLGSFMFIIRSPWQIGIGPITSTASSCSFSCSVAWPASLN